MVRRLLLLNGWATLGVVVNHSLAWGFIAMFWWTHRYLPVTTPNFDQMYSGSYFALRFVEQLIAPSIPAFIFVSGFFIAFAAGREASLSRNVILPRLKYLVIPYLFWSVVMLLVERFQGEVHSPADYLKMLALGQTTPAFYFVPLLCQLYLLAPWLVRLAKQHPRWLLLGAALIQIVAHLAQYAVLLNITLPAQPVFMALTPAWFFPSDIFWFALGMVVGFHYASVKAWLNRLRWVWLAATITFLLLGILEWEVLLKLSGQTWLAPKETLIDNLYSLGLLLSFLAFEKVSYPFSKAFGDLGTKSFGIYLVHSLVLTYLAKAIYHFLPWVLSSQLLLQPLLVVVGLGLPMLLMTIVKNSPARRVYAYQFG